MAEAVSTQFGFAAPWYVAGGRRWRASGRPPRNPALRNAARAYVRRGLDLLRQEPGAYELKILPVAYWLRESPGFTRRARLYVAFRPTLVEALHHLPEFSALSRELERDAAVARHLDQLVGSASHAARRLDRAELTDGWITRNVSATGDLTFDQAAFEGDYVDAQRP